MQAIARKEIDDPGHVTRSRYVSGSGPACGDVLRGIQVRVELTAGCAGKKIQGPHPDPPALMAAERGIGRIDLDHPDSLRRGFVPDEFAELPEGPQRDHPVPMPVANLQTISDAAELFQGDRGASVLSGLLNDPFGDAVVFPAGAPPLVSRKPFQGALGAFRAPGLETRAGPPPVFPILSEYCSVKSPACGGRSQAANPQIDTQGAPFGDLGDLLLDGDVDPVAVLSFDEDGRLGNWGSPEGLMLIVRDQESGRDALPRGGEGDHSLGELQGKGSGIESHEGGPELEAAFEFRMGKGGGGPSQSGNGQIGRESVVPPDPMIELMLETNRVRFLVIATPCGNLRASLGVALEEGIDQIPFVRGNQNPASNGSDALHPGKVSSSCVMLGHPRSGTFLRRGQTHGGFSAVHFVNSSAPRCARC